MSLEKIYVRRAPGGFPLLKVVPVTLVPIVYCEVVFCEGCSDTASLRSFITSMFVTFCCTNSWFSPVVPDGTIMA